MSDITNTNLEAALIDQDVAGTFPGQAYAFIAVVRKGGWQLGVAVANERGYNPIPGKSFADRDEANEWADSLNAHIGLSEDKAWDIIASTMGGRRYG